ncbi:MAG: transcription termination factor NusA [Patescibacteria group bacterium]
MSLNSDDLKQQIELICIERGLEAEEVIKAIEVAIASAYRKELGDKEKAYEAKFNDISGKYSVYETITVVEELLNPGREINLIDAKLTDPSAQVGDVLRSEVVIDQEIEFGRIAAQVARQVMFQSINSARHTKVLQQFKDKIGEVVSVEVDFYKKGGYSVKLAQTTGFISRENLLPIDKFKPGQVVKAIILDITEDAHGNSRIVLSRSHIDFIKAIIANEIPEVEAGIVTIDKIVREPGSRSKILVSANEDESVDPVGTILGRKNVRIMNVMREITTTLQEKIDIIENRPDDLELMITDALEPAEIERVEISEDRKTADVYCYPDVASLAVGRRGVNIRLAGDLLDMVLSLKTLEDSDYSPKIVT